MRGCSEHEISPPYKPSFGCCPSCSEDPRSSELCTPLSYHGTLKFSTTSGNGDCGSAVFSQHFHAVLDLLLKCIEHRFIGQINVWDEIYGPEIEQAYFGSVISLRTEIEETSTCRLPTLHSELPGSVLRPLVPGSFRLSVQLNRSYQR